jgi:hypothetical protein
VSIFHGGLITDTTPEGRRVLTRADERLEPVDVRPDPRFSNLRPAWLVDDEQWRDQLQALPRDDAVWIAEQWEMAGGAEPDIDRSWMRTETIGDPHWAWPVLILFWVAALALLVLGAWEVLS